MTYSLVIALCWLALLGVWVVTMFTAKRTVQRSFAHMWVRIAVALVVLLLFISPGHYLSKLTALQFGAAASALGVVLCALGAGVAIWARLYLGRNWGMPMTLRQGHELITTGPYAWVRHPIYSGIMLAMLGSALVSPWWVLILVIFSAYFVYSVREEEKHMLKQFPDAYPAYMRRTKRLVPFVY